MNIFEGEGELMRESNFEEQLIWAPSNCRSTLFDELFLDFHSFDDEEWFSSIQADCTISTSWSVNNFDQGH